MNDKDFAEMMEMKTNKAAKEIVKVLVNGNMPPLATMVSIVKASAIMLESFRASGEVSYKTNIGPASQRALCFYKPKYRISKMNKTN